MFRMQRMGVLFALCLPLASPASPCDLRLEVTMREQQHLQPVFPAVVYVDELQQSFEANHRGVVVIPNLCVGVYTLRVQSVGYERYMEQVSVRGNLERVLLLSHLEERLGAVTVRSESIPTVLQDKASLGKEELMSQSGRTISEVLSQLNGVTMLSNGGTINKPVIHGLHSNRIVIMNQGVRLEDQQWGGEHAPNMDPFQANRVTVVKGAASVRYGADAIGGVVLVEPAPLRSEPGWAGAVNLAGFGNNRMGVAHAMADYRLLKAPLAFRVQATIKRGGNYRIPGYWAANTGISEQHFSIATGYRGARSGIELLYSRFNTGLGIYRGAHTGNEADLRAAVASPVPLVPATFTYDYKRPYQKVRHDLLKAQWYADTRVGIWHVAYAFQHNYRQEYDVQRIENSRAQLNLTLNTHTVAGNLDHRALGCLKGQIGVDGIIQEHYFKPGDRLFIPNYRSVGGGAYLIERMNLYLLRLEAGLRLDHRGYEVFNPEGPNQQVVRYQYAFQNLSGTVGVQYAPLRDLDLSLTLSNAWRAPQANELFSAGLHHGAARIEVGNKALQPERSCQVNITAKYVWRERLNVDASVYRQYINHFIYLEPGADVLTIRGFFKSFQYRQTNAQLSGTDLSVRYALSSRWSSTMQASLLRAWNRDAGDWLILMPADRGRVAIQYQWPVNRAFCKRISWDVQTRYVTAQRRIPRNFDAIDFPRPPAAYFVTDVMLSADIALLRQAATISLSVNNFMNRRYRDYLDLFRYFLDQPGRDVVFRLHIPFHSNKKS